VWARVVKLYTPRCRSTRSGPLAANGAKATNRPVLETGGSEDGERLNIRLVGGNVEISWAADATGWVLEQCVSLVGTPLWAAVSPVPAGHVHVTRASDASRFFRFAQTLTVTLPIVSSEP
jgi:hypothetical protein